MSKLVIDGSGNWSVFPSGVLHVMDSTDWTNEDFNRLDSTENRKRADVAKEITESKNRSRFTRKFGL